MTRDPAWPEGYALKEFDELDSTNEEARRLAAAGAAAPVWIRADRQTAGRGRRGRHWETPAGNLAATLLLRPDRPAARMRAALLRRGHCRRRNAWRSGLPKPDDTREMAE